jgi:hypothetical protein
MKCHRSLVFKVFKVFKFEYAMSITEDEVRIQRESGLRPARVMPGVVLLVWILVRGHFEGHFALQARIPMIIIIISWPQSVFRKNQALARSTKTPAGSVLTESNQ